MAEPTDQGAQADALNAAGHDCLKAGDLQTARARSSEALKIGSRALSVAEIDRNRIPLPFPLASHLIYDGTSIRNALGFAYTPFVSGMEKTYAWYCQSRRAA